MAARKKVRKTTRPVRVAKASAHKTSGSPLLILSVLAVVAILGTSIYLFTNSKVDTTSYAPYPFEQSITSFDFGNSMIMLNNEELQFQNGAYAMTDSASGPHKAQVMHRAVNQAGTQAGAILVDNPGGSGTFYYLVGGTMVDGKEVYSTPVLLGDRVKIVSVNVENPTEENNGTVTVEYMDRPTGAPMSADPNQLITVTYAFEENGMLTPVLAE